MSGQTSRAKKLGLACLGVLLLLGLALGGALLAERDPLPESTPGPDAEALADRLEAAVDLPAWRRTGAVQWTFAGRQEHLWDRRRGLARVRFGDAEVLLRLRDQSGRAYRGGAEVTDDAERRALLQKAWAFWCNDSFWLNPLAKLRDGGTTRGLANVDGKDALLITYGGGGVTPGDRYLWILGDEELPTRWQMWVSILPVGGVDATWEDWITLDTGAKISTHHALLGGLSIDLTDVKGAATLAKLTSGDDPFAPLLKR